MHRFIFLRKGALSGLFFFITLGFSFSQEILWKGEELQSGNYKSINGEIVIRTPTDTIKASKARLYNTPKKAILKENLSLTRSGTHVTGDSAIYFVSTRLAQIIGHAIINTQEGIIRSNQFDYFLNSKQLVSNSFTDGTASGIKFSADRSVILTSVNQILLIGRAKWENDTVRGTADTIFLDKSSNLLTMSKKARIYFKNKKDEVTGTRIELDLKANKISKIEGSVIKRNDATIKAKSVEQNGEAYVLRKEVLIQSQDSSLTSTGDYAHLQKNKSTVEGNTVTTLVDSDNQKIIIYSPTIKSSSDSGKSRYNFYTTVNVRGSFLGYCDSLAVIKKDSGEREIYLYRDVHLQNDSIYLEGDSVELFQDSTREIIRAKRNALMLMITPPERLNVITAAYIELVKTKTQSEIYATGSTESYLWNDEKSNIGLNHTKSNTQRAWIKEKKVTKVIAKGNVTSRFSPLNKVNYSYLDAPTLQINETYKADSLARGLKSVPHFIKSRTRSKK